MLTIGQLAAYTGVTVRAIRFYHQRGLLAEAARDASGYRRYDGQAAVELIRIKALAAAGVPLARIRELLDAEPGEFAASVTQIDEALKRKIREFTQHRRKIAELNRRAGRRDGGLGGEQPRADLPGETPASVAAVALLSSSIIGSSPAWERLNELSQKRLETLQTLAGRP